MITQDKYLPWFIIKSIPGIGNHLYKRLIDQFKTPENILAAKAAKLATIRGISQKVITGIVHCKVEKKARIELAAVLRRKIRLMTMNDPAYPPLLREIADPPPFFTFQGELNGDMPCISIVGSRNATTYGLESAYRLGYDLAALGFQVVSGMARGIDTAAHRGALAAKGRTMAILGSGLNWIYPRENQSLFQAICRSGAVISEFSPDTRPEPRNFPIRNRIIAGISTGTIVVEAASKSGSLITARLAADFSREVFAVPGSINSHRSHGTHALIREGATLVETHRDVIRELHHMVHAEPLDPLSGPRAKNKDKKELNRVELAIVTVLEPYPLHIDKIVEKTDLDVASISAALLDLELKGMVRQLPGKLFSIKEE